MDPTPYTEELHAIPIPPPLSSQFEKPSKEAVIARHVSRFSQGGDGTQHTGQLDQETAGGYKLNNTGEDNNPHISSGTPADKAAVGQITETPMAAKDDLKSVYKTWKNLCEM